MLYNPKWNGSKVLELSNFIAWLEQFPIDKEYDYMLSDCCLLAQYFQAHGLEYHAVLTCSDNPQALFERIACDEPETFGAALERARKLL